MPGCPEKTRLQGLAHSFLRLVRALSNSSMRGVIAGDYGFVQIVGGVECLAAARVAGDAVDLTLTERQAPGRENRDARAAGERERRNLRPHPRPDSAL